MEHAKYAIQPVKNAPEMQHLAQNAQLEILKLMETENAQHALHLAQHAKEPQTSALLV